MAPYTARQKLNGCLHVVCCYAGGRKNNELHIAISYYPADELLFSFLTLTSSSVILLGSGYGLDIIKIPAQQQALTLAVSLDQHLNEA